MKALKPLAMNDLRKHLTATREQPNLRDLQQEFKYCKFRKLSLGKLGTGVLMEYSYPDGGPNSGAYTIYLRRNGGYSRIAQRSGFGPYVLRGINDIPDLAFGGTAGVCTEQFVRLRYSGISYKPDACVQNVRDTSPEGCHPETCNDPRKLPIFPIPDQAAMQ